MINTKKNVVQSAKLFFSLAIIVTASGNLSLAAEPTTGSLPQSADDSTFGLPATTMNQSEVVGLPYSNQWISERIASYIYVSYNSAQMNSQSIAVGPYVSNFGSTGYSFPTIDYFNDIVSLAGPESRSFLRDFALTGRYSLGFADRTGQANNTQTPIDSSVENVSLLIFSARVGALLTYEHLSWFRPYAGIEIDPYFFRNTSDLSGAEQQGENFGYGPVVGAHFPVLFGGRASVLAEFHKTLAASGSGQIFSDSTNYTAGMGLTF
jgi:hypothetical protein